MHSRIDLRLLRVCASLLFSLGVIAPCAAQGLLDERLSDALTDDFALSLANAGDIDGDGISDIAVGGKGNSAWPGMAYVLSGVDRQVIYVFFGTNHGDRFGWAVAGVGDVNGDGRDDLGVGAPAAAGGGEVRILSGLDGSTIWTWTQMASSYFGSSLDGAGDVNGDGFDDVVVGASLHSGMSGSESGRVVVLSGQDGLPLQLRDGLAGEQLGHRVRGGFDLSGDGVPDFLVTQNGQGSTSPGFARVYSGATGALVREFLPSAVQTGFGFDAVFVGDLTGDGRTELAVGAPEEDGPAGARAGAVHVYNGATGALLRTLRGRDAGAQLGHAVGVTEDLDGDSFPELLLGAPGNTPLVGYVEIVSTGTWASLLHVEGNKQNFVQHVAGLGDLDGDGLGDFALADQWWKHPTSLDDGRVRVHSIAPAPPVSFCTAKVNSLGCTPSMATTGLPSLSGPDDLHLRATNVLNKKPGILIWGPFRGGKPFKNGFLCLSSPIFRTTAQVAGGSPVGLDCSGTYDFHFSHTYMGLAGLQAGDTVYSQYWSRDQGFSQPNNSGLTDGLIFTIGL